MDHVRHVYSRSSSIYLNYWITIYLRYLPPTDYFYCFIWNLDVIFHFKKVRTLGQMFQNSFQGMKLQFENIFFGGGGVTNWNINWTKKWKVKYSIVKSIRVFAFWDIFEPK